MVGQLAGFRELEHTADWQLEVWAPDLPGVVRAVCTRHVRSGWGSPASRSPP